MRYSLPYRLRTPYIGWCPTTMSSTDAITANKLLWLECELAKEDHQTPEGGDEDTRFGSILDK